MKRLSTHTATLIERLNQPVTLREQLTGSRKYDRIFAAIADANEPAAIIEILPFTLATNTSVAAAAAVAVHKLLLATPAADLISLDLALRNRSTYSGVPIYEWHKLSPAQLGVLEHFGDATVSLLALASFHQNGYVRQAAIRKLSFIRTGAELPFLILRLNDWVSNVRDAAYVAIHSRLTPDHCRHFIANLSLMSRFIHAARGDHKKIIHEISQLVQSDRCRPALLESLQSEDRFNRRASFRLALDPTNSELEQTVMLALDDDDTVIRRWAAQTISSGFEAAKLEYFLNRLKRDHFMPVRREAFRIAVAMNSPQLIDELRIGLLDPDQSIREHCRYHLQKIQAIDVAAFYRQHLAAAEGRNLYSAISGLGETGRAEDDSLIVPYTSHQVSKIRRAAIKALQRLHPETHHEIFIRALEDEAPSVSRQALQALTFRKWSVSAVRLWELFRSTPHAHVKRNAILLMQKCAKWESISYLVRGVCDADESIVNMSRLGIERWLYRFNRSFSTPSSEQLANLTDALEECGTLLDEKTRQELSFSTRGF